MLPLGVGGHVDHLVCFELRTLLEPFSRRVLFYEDFPYLTSPADVALRHASLRKHGLQPIRHQLEVSAAAMVAHQDAAALYISQVAGFRLPGAAEPKFLTRDHLNGDVEWLLHTRFDSARSPRITLWSF